MPNYNTLIYTAADYKLLLLDGGTPLPLLTLSAFDASVKTEDETIFAIGEVEPIGEKSNGTQYTGKLEIQAGELYAYMKIKGYANPTEIRNANLALTSLDGLINFVYSGVNIISGDFSIKAKDKQSMISMNWKAVSVKSL